MFDVMASHYSGEEEMELDDIFKFPKPIEYKLEEDRLPNHVKHMQLRHARHWKQIEKRLTEYNRCIVQTEGGKNNLFRSVLLQMHIPKRLTPNIVRHQVAEFMTENVSFFYPKMKEYLDKNKLSFNAYIKHVYKGNIWADEYVLGALGKMYNVKISIISPYCSDIWNVFHNSTIPDIVLVANGNDFKGKHNITHFTMTKGKTATWKCVGSEVNIREIGSHRGFSNGKSTAISLYEAKEKQNILTKTENIVKELDSICHDLKNLYIRRDQLLEELNEMHVSVQQFKRFERYFIAESVDSSTKQKTGSRKELSVSTKQKERKKSKPEKRKATEQLKAKPFPKELGEKLLSDAVKEIDRGTDKLELEDEGMLHKLYEPARIRCQERNLSTDLPDPSATFPPLPSIPECEALLQEAKEFEQSVKISEHRQNVVQETEGCIIPLDLNKKTVITSQPTRSNVFSKEILDEPNVPLFRQVPVDTPKDVDVMYSEMIMSKGVADFLNEPIAEVHKSCEKADTLVTVEVEADEIVMEEDSEIRDTLPDDKNVTSSEEKVLKVTKFKKLADDPNREIIYLPQQIDTSKMAGPVPLAEQLVGYEYCTLCDKRFKDKRYLKIHATRLCPFLTVVERVKCRLCGKVYLQDKTYRDHLTKHTKVERYQCPRCGKKFAHQNSRFRHDKLCK